MHSAETTLDQARRHVLSGEATLDAQNRRIDRLRELGADTALAQELLRSFMEAHRLALDHLSREETRACEPVLRHIRIPWRLVPH